MKPGPDFLHSIFDVTHVEFQTYDLSNAKLIFSSGVAHQMLGFPEDEFFDLSSDFYKSIIHPDDFHMAQETIKKVMQSKDGEVIEMTVRARRSDGFYIWVHSRQMIYQRSSDGKACTIITEVEDLTKLIGIQNELEEKVRQLEVVSYKNSHLLRSPVASIIGLVEIIDEQGITSEHNMKIFNFLKEAITKLDVVIREINNAAHA
jgi:PAS domain S-box-containing protein